MVGFAVVLRPEALLRKMKTFYPIWFQKDQVLELNLPYLVNRITAMAHIGLGFHIHEIQCSECYFIFFTACLLRNCAADLHLIAKKSQAFLSLFPITPSVRVCIFIL